MYIPIKKIGSLFNFSLIIVYDLLEIYVLNSTSEEIQQLIVLAAVHR